MHTQDAGQHRALGVVWRWQVGGRWMTREVEAVGFLQESPTPSSVSDFVKLSTFNSKILFNKRVSPMPEMF